MPDRPAPYEGLGYLIHFDRLLQCQSVDDCGEHTHLIGGDAVHVLGLLGDAAKEIAPTNYDRQLYAQLVDVFEFGCDLVNALDLHAKALVCRQSLAGYFEQNAFEGRSRHGQWLVASGQCNAAEESRLFPATPA